MSEPLHIVCPHCSTTNRVKPDQLASHPDCGQCHQPLFTGHPVALDDETAFDKHVLRSQIPVLVDFWAPWCGPCRAVAPVLEELAGQYDGKLSIVKLNTDENPATSAKYGITGIPTMNVYQNGEVVKTIVGAMPKPKLLRELEPFIG